MKRRRVLGVAVAGMIVATTSILNSTGVRSGQSNSGNGSVERLYVLDCGVGHSNDQSNWTNEIGVGKPIDISVSCYLMRHPLGYLLYDTGVSDLVGSMPNGWQAGGNAQGIRWTLAKTLAAQLAEIKVAPSDVRYVALSHTHPDAIGNVEMFPNSIVLIQRLEYEETFAPDRAPLAAPPQQPTTSFRPDHPVRLLQGDTDVFGDGSVTLVSTPGHTAGHQSLLVRLPKTGWVILTGDAVHLQTNWDNRRIPYFARNTMGENNVAGVKMWLSMQRLADLQAFYKAQLWILHDIEQTKKLRHAPEYYE